MSATPETSKLVRVSIDDAELRELRRRALDLDVSTPALLAQLVRRELAKAARVERKGAA